MKIKQASFFLSTTYIDTEDLEEKLSSRVFKKCGKMDEQSIGFVKPSDYSGSLVDKVGDIVHMRLRIDKKVMPKAAIDEKTAMLTHAYILNNGKAPDKKSLKFIKHDAKLEVCKEALCSSSFVNIFKVGGSLFIVDTQSEALAEKAISMLRLALNDLEAKLPKTQTKANDFLFDCLRSRQLPKDFEFRYECSLFNSAEKSKFSFKNYDIEQSDTIKNLLESESVTCTQIGLCWIQKMSFTCMASQAKTLKFSKIHIQSQVADSDDEDKEAKHYADLKLAIDSIANAFWILVEACNGLAEDKQEESEQQ